jgi:UDPglucose 6-dehydrogenase
MKLAVIGLWHLGCVTSACLANAGYNVIAYDADVHTINQLREGKTPLFEPGLEELLIKGVHTGKLHFTLDILSLSHAEIIWITFDIPVDENDQGETDLIIHQIEAIFPHLQNNALVIISSQLPVGSTQKLQTLCFKQFPHKNITFAYSPENLRLGKAIDIFNHPDRVVVGLQGADLRNKEATQRYHLDKTRITQLLKPFTDKILWMSIESAEMTKHALNAFLATSVVFINELSSLCEKVGANPYDVEQGLKSEERIGPKAYLRPGSAIAGGTLMRDVNYLIEMGKEKSLDTHLFSALLKSNHVHKQWSCRKIMDVFKHVTDKTITILGLSYKVGTDTLRRSSAIEAGEWLAKQGAKIVAYDPAIKTLPHYLSTIIDLKLTLNDALKNVDAVIIATEWPEFTAMNAEELLAQTKNPYIFDAGRFLAKNWGQDSRIRYFSVGKNPF